MYNPGYLVSCWTLAFKVNLSETQPQHFQPVLAAFQELLIDGVSEVRTGDQQIEKDVSASQNDLCP